MKINYRALVGLALAIITIVIAVGPPRPSREYYSEQRMEWTSIAEAKVLRFEIETECALTAEDGIPICRTVDTRAGVCCYYLPGTPGISCLKILSNDANFF